MSDIERLKSMKESLMSCVNGQLSDLKSANAEELGEAIDMIKDLSEAVYYCSIVEAMDDSKDEKKISEAVNAATDRQMYYSPYTMYPMYRSRQLTGYDDSSYYDGSSRRGYSGAGTGAGTSGNGGGRMYSDYRYPTEMRDYREGRSGMMRRSYMEAQEQHQDKAKMIQEMEQYISELSTDVMDMIKSASAEEKQTLKTKLTTLANKIV